MKGLFFCIVSIATATAFADVTAYWTYANNTITDGEWTLKTTGSRDALTVGAPTVKPNPNHGILDLTKPIDGGGAFTAIAANNTFYGSGLVSITMPDTITSIGYKAFWQVTTLKDVRLSENLETIGYQAFYNCTALTNVAPFLPASVTTIGYSAFDTCQNLLSKNLSIAASGGGVTFGLNGSNATQFNNDATITNITLGAGVSLLPNNIFQKCTGVTDVWFMGSKPSISGNPFTGWSDRIYSGGWRNCGQSRFHVPDNDPAWQAWAAANATPWDELADSSAKSFYATRWPDGIVPYGRIATSQSANGLIGTYHWLCFYTPEGAQEGTKDLVVAGSPGEYGAASVSPAYGTYTDIASFPGLPMALTAPQYAESGSIRYQCTGYVLETFDNMAWTGATTNALADPAAPSVTYNPSDAGLQRITWLWEVAGYRLSVADPPEVSGGSVTVSGAGNGGFFTPGSTATVTATAGSAAFVRWYGDVPSGHETDTTLQIVMDGPKSLEAEFATDWVYSANRLTDGYWTLNASGSRDALTVGAPTVTPSIGNLDLAKPIVDGGTIVAIADTAFQRINTLKSVVLPETLRSIGNQAFYQCEGLETVTPFLPAATVTFGYNCFNTCSRLGGSLSIASGGGATSFILNYQGAGSHFSSTAITNVTFGAGVSAIPNSCFMRCYSLKSVGLSDALASIGPQAFYQCTALERVTPFLPSGTRSLGYNCFNGCTALGGELAIAARRGGAGVVFGLSQSSGGQFGQTVLTGISLGAGVTNVPPNCFNQCRSVRNLRFAGAVPALASTAFGSWNQNQCVVSVPRTDATWDNWIETNVTPWESLAADVQALYTAAWPDGKTPAGRTRSTANPAIQWVLRYLPGNAPTTILVQ